MIKCIKIDVDNRIIHEVEINDNIQDIYKQIGCSMFEVVRIDDINDIYVDEEGLLNLTDETMFFKYDGYHQPISGNGLIMGHNDMGESISTTLTISEVKKKVKFLTIQQVRQMVE